MIGNTIIIGALLLNRKDRKNHEKRATKRSHQYMNIFWVRFFLVPLLLLLLHVARLSIDLFDRPKIRDMHINKANFLLSFFPYSLPFYAASCCSVHFFTILATVRLTWHKLIRWIDIFFRAHATNIYYMQSAYYFCEKAIIIQWMWWFARVYPCVPRAARNKRNPILRATYINTE